MESSSTLASGDEDGDPYDHEHEERKKDSTKASPSRAVPPFLHRPSSILVRSAAGSRLSLHSSASAASLVPRRSWLKRALKHLYLFLKSGIALASTIVCWLGVWELFDLYLFPKSFWRDVLYIIVCTAGMLLCGTFLANCGIYEDTSVQEATTKAEIDHAEEVATVIMNSPMPTIDERYMDHPDAGQQGLDMQHRQQEPSDAATQSDEHAQLITARHSTSYLRVCMSLLSVTCTRTLFIRVYLSSFLSLFVSIGFWSGSYNLILACFLGIANKHEALAYSLAMGVGWTLMVLTDTLFEQAGMGEMIEKIDSLGEMIRPTHQVQHANLPLFSSRAHFYARAALYIRATLGLIGCMMYWLGESMLLELLSDIFYSHNTVNNDPGILHCNACTESTPSRNATFIALGLFLFVLTGTLAIHAGIEESNLSNEQQQQQASVRNLALSRDPSSSSLISTAPPAPTMRQRVRHLLIHPLALHVRALLSLTGVMMLWEGLWDQLFDANAESRGWKRMALYSGAGVIGLMVTGTLFANSGVVPPFGVAKKSMHVQKRLGFHLQEKETMQLNAEISRRNSMLDLYANQPHLSGGDHSESGPAVSRTELRIELSSPSYTLSPPLATSSSTKGQLTSSSSPANLSPVPTPPPDAATAIGDSRQPFQALRGD